MLSSLRIQNLALVEDLSIEYAPGFTVLTGETGAGKSLLVDALALLVGARGDGELVRLGTERAVVEGVLEGAFEPWRRFLAERGLPEEQPVVVRREVGVNNRSRAWINGASCALADLKEAGRIWMRLASQHDHQSLLAEDRHLGLLDEVLGLDPDLSGEAQAVREAEARLKARRKSASEREQRLEWLSEQIADLEKLNPKIGEWASLRAEREPLRHGAQLEVAFREAAEALNEARPGAEQAHRAMARVATILPDAQKDVDRLRSLVLELEDLLALSKDEAQGWSRNGAARIEALETRLALYEKLARRHRSEPEDLAQKLLDFQAEQKSLLAGESALEELEAQLTKAAEAYRAAAHALHQKREALIPPLEKEVHRRLARLGMSGARIQARLSLAQEASSPVTQNGCPVRVSATGFSALALWIEPNAGEGFRPLAKIASGGEMSRLMLSMMLAGLSLSKDSAEPRTLVLDEVDSGIGGETALSVGEAIQELGKHHQVLAVTHLAQVAARADHHGRLSKSTQSGRTRSELAWLTGEDRVPELARLLSGHPERAEAQNHARSLLAGV